MQPNRFKPELSCRKGQIILTSTTAARERAAAHSQQPCCQARTHPHAAALVLHLHPTQSRRQRPPCDTPSSTPCPLLRAGAVRSAPRAPGALPGTCGCGGAEWCTAGPAGLALRARRSILAAQRGGSGRSVSVKNDPRRRQRGGVGHAPGQPLGTTLSHPSRRWDPPALLQGSVCYAVFPLQLLRNSCSDSAAARTAGKLGAARRAKKRFCG